MIATHPGAVRVDLLPTDQARIRSHCLAIVDAVRRNRWQDKYGTTRDDRRLPKLVDAMGAEQAVALALGSTWNPVVLDATYRRDRKGPDVGRYVEVRTSLYPARGLRAYPVDALTVRRGWVTFVLAWGAFPTYLVVGWLPGDELIVPRYRVDDGAFHGWQAPAADLRPIASLPRDLI